MTFTQEEAKIWEKQNIKAVEEEIYEKSYKRMYKEEVKEEWDFLDEDNPHTE